MQSFIPQKDTALVLSKAARSFITSCNYSLAKEGLSFLVPQFPLYAFADKLPASDFVSCRIDMPQGDGRSFFFPVSLYPMEGWQEISLKIVFAKMQEQTDKKKPHAGKNKMHRHCIRTKEVFVVCFAGI